MSRPIQVKPADSESRTGNILIFYLSIGSFLSIVYLLADIVFKSLINI